MVSRLSPKAEARIRELTERGGYESPEAVIGEALRVREERDRYAELKAAIAVGVEQVERGEVVEWTPDFFDRLTREAFELARSGKPIKDEGRP